MSEYKRSDERSDPEQRDSNKTWLEKTLHKFPKDIIKSTGDFVGCAAHTELGKQCKYPFLYNIYSAPRKYKTEVDEHGRKYQVETKRDKQDCASYCSNHIDVWIRELLQIQLTLVTPTVTSSDVRTTVWVYCELKQKVLMNIPIVFKFILNEDDLDYSIGHFSEQDESWESIYVDDNSNDWIAAINSMNIKNIYLSAKFKTTPNRTANRTVIRMQFVQPRDGKVFENKEPEESKEWHSHLYDLYKTIYDSRNKSYERIYLKFKEELIKNLNGVIQQALDDEGVFFEMIKEVLMGEDTEYTAMSWRDQKDFMYYFLSKRPELELGDREYPDFKKSNPLFAF